MARRTPVRVVSGGEEPTGPDRIPPNNLEAEQCALGSMMVEVEAISTASELLTTSSFYRPSHQIIFDAIMRIHGRGEPADLITVCEELRPVGDLDKAGGPAYLNSLIAMVPTAANQRTYVHIVQEKARLRELATIGTEIARLGFETDEADEAINKAQGLLIGLSESGDKGGFQHVSVPIKRELARLSQIRDGQLEIVGIPTPFLQINKATLGLQPGRVTILGGDPGQGKTMVAVQTILSGLKADPNMGCAVFTLEMVAEQYAHKLISAFSGHDGYGLQRPASHPQAIDGEAWRWVFEQAETLGGRRIWIDDGLPRFEQCRSRLLRLAAREKIDLVVIDYIQLVRTEASIGSEASELATIARQILELAKTLNCHMLLVSQFRRPIMTGQVRPDPTIRDFKASGGLEEIASHALLLSRKPNAAVAKLNLAKNKFGPEVAAELTWDKTKGIYGGGHHFWSEKKDKPESSADYQWEGS